MATAPTSDSGRLEKKIATRSESDAVSTSDTPSARFSGTPSSVTAASSAQPETAAAARADHLALLRVRPTAEVAIERGVRGDERRRPGEQPEPGACHPAERECFLEQFEGQRRDQGAAGEGEQHTGDPPGRAPPHTNDGAHDERAGRGQAEQHGGEHEAVSHPRPRRIPRRREVSPGGTFRAQGTPGRAGRLNFDVLRRWLARRGHDVLFVRNVTDIDDRILAKAADAGRPWWEWSATHERAFEEAYTALGCLPPSVLPRATGHVPEMVELMRRLIDRGHAYAADGDVYFSVASFPDYGTLSGQRPSEVQQGESADTGKRDPGTSRCGRPPSPVSRAGPRRGGGGGPAGTWDAWRWPPPTSVRSSTSTAAGSI
jgi:hypothetical protein